MRNSFPLQQFAVLILFAAFRTVSESKDTGSAVGELRKSVYPTIPKKREELHEVCRIAQKCIWMRIGSREWESCTIWF